MNGESRTATSRLRFLIDSNVVVAAEPFNGDIETGMPAAATLVRLSNSQGHVLCVAPANRDDMREGRDLTRTAQRLAELEKFTMLQEAPLPDKLLERAGSSETGSNDHRDLRLLALVHAGAVQFLVTDDHRLRARATRAGLGEQVLSLSAAVDLLKSFEPAQPAPPRHVASPACYTIRTDDPIFGGLRADYGPSFDEWLERVAAESAIRTLFVIEQDHQYAALAIVKPEADCDYGFHGPVLKLCTFKVSDDHWGVKYGELLLNAVLRHARVQATPTIYVTVLPKHDVLLAFFGEFGFVDTGRRTHAGEHVLSKRCIPSEADEGLTDLKFHIAFGPPALKLTQRTFVVPIQSRWYEQLFPDDPTVRKDAYAEPTLFDASRRPSGNALRKAYLSNSSTNQVQPGDAMLFYRSDGIGLVTAVGVVESVLRSSDPSALLSFVGVRTVYTPQQVVDLSGSVRGVLAIRFRHDRFVDPGWGRDELVAARVLNGAPQSITKVPEEGKLWIQQQLGV
jgi:GNAT superfamily N-acetyltransferase